MHTINVIIMGFPRVIRHCAHCGEPKPFVPTDKFRINGQKKLLDVWLIYKCAVCDATWKMEIYSRVAVSKLDKGLFQLLNDNDAQLARRFAFDAAAHARLKSVLDYDQVSFTFEETVGANANPWRNAVGRVELELICDIPAGVRIAALIRELLCISGTHLARLAKAGAINLEGGQDILKARMGARALVSIDMDQLPVER